MLMQLATYYPYDENQHNPQNPHIFISTGFVPEDRYIAKARSPYSSGSSPHSIVFE
jgi:hypothetical protein